MLADVGAGTRLGLHYAAGATLFIADDTQLRRLHTTRQVHIENCAELLQKLSGRQEGKNVTTRAPIDRS